MATTISSGRGSSPLLTADVASRAEVYGGRGIVFDGATDYLSVAEDVLQGQSQATISFWTKTSNTGTQSILGWYRTNWVIRLNKTDIFFGVNNEYLTASTSLDNSSWGMHTITFNSGTAKFYKNGELYYTTTHYSDNGVTSIPGGYPTLIGKRNHATPHWYNGTIADVKLLNTALTEAQIQELYLKPEQSAPSAVQSNLKLWLPMCEGLAESVAYDHSGNNNHAVAYGAYTLATAENEPLIPQVPLMRYNEKMLLDGSDDKIEIANSADSDLQLSTLTISAWIKPNGADEDGYIFSKFDDSTSGGYALNFQGSTDKIRLLSSGVTIGTSDAVFVDDNVWVHIAVTVDGSGNLVYYRNGVSAGTASSVTLNTNSVGVVIGNRTGGSSAGHYFNGLIDETSIFNNALTQTQVAELYNSGTALDATTHSKKGNLLAYYRNDGVTKWQDRRGWSYLDFDGNGDYIQLPMAFSHTTHSISIWYNDSTGNKYLFDARDDSNHGIGLSVNTNGTLWYAVRGDETNSVTSSSGSLNTWNNVVVTYNGSTAKIYLNGSDVGTGSFSDTISTTANARIGALAYSTSGYFTGGIASVGLYTTAKSLSEAQDIYNQGFTGDESTNSGIFAYYKLDTASTSSGAVKDLVGTNHGTVNGNPTLNTGNDGDVSGNPNSITIREGLTSGKDGLGFPLKNADSNVVRFDSSVESEKIIIPAMPFEYRTISFWFKTNKDFTSSSTKMPFLDIEDTTYAGLFIGSLTTSNLGSGSSNELFIISGDSGNTGYEDNTNTIYANTWYHLALIWDDANSYYKFYLNTVAKTSDTTSNHFDLQSNKRIQIGRRTYSDSSSYFDGMIDEVKIYNKSLSPTELSKNYKHGKGKHKND